jgi:hypothetical protein
MKPNFCQVNNPVTSAPQIAENKTTLSLLLAALTDFAPVTPVVATLTKTAGVYTNSSHSGTRHSPLVTRHFFPSEAPQSLPFFASISAKTQNPLFCFQSLAHSSALMRGWGPRLAPSLQSNLSVAVPSRLRENLCSRRASLLSPEHAPAGGFCNYVPRKEGQTR